MSISFLCVFKLNFAFLPFGPCPFGFSSRDPSGSRERILRILNGRLPRKMLYRIAEVAGSRYSGTKEEEMAQKKKVEKILERTKKRLIKDLEEAKKRMAEFRKRTTTLAKKAREEARKTARISRLRLEVLPLVQKRDRKLKELGKKSYYLVKSRKISGKGLKSLGEEIRDLETKIRRKEKEIKQLRK